jgi:hypothetical protein
VIHERLRRAQRAIRFESEVEGYKCRDAYRRARDYANESLIAQTAANQPVDDGAGQRGEDNQTKKMTLYQLSIFLVTASPPDVRKAYDLPVSF